MTAAQAPVVLEIFQPRNIEQKFLMMMDITKGDLPISLSDSYLEGGRLEQNQCEKEGNSPSVALLRVIGNFICILEKNVTNSF